MLVRGKGLVHEGFRELLNSVCRRWLHIEHFPQHSLGSGKIRRKKLQLPGISKLRELYA